MMKKTIECFLFEAKKVIGPDGNNTLVPAYSSGFSVKKFPVDPVVGLGHRNEVETVFFERSLFGGTNSIADVFFSDSIIDLGFSDIRSIHQLHIVCQHRGRLSIPRSA